MLTRDSIMKVRRLQSQVGPRRMDGSALPRRQGEKLKTNKRRTHKMKVTYVLPKKQAKTMLKHQRVIAKASLGKSSVQAKKLTTRETIQPTAEQKKRMQYLNAADKVANSRS